jgi:hypothetical protein
MSEMPNSSRQTTGSLNWTNIVTVISAAILIGTEIVGAGFATGWAIAGLFGLGNIGAYVLQGLFGLLAAYIIFKFVRRQKTIVTFFVLSKSAPRAPRLNTRFIFASRA